MRTLGTALHAAAIDLRGAWGRLCGAKAAKKVSISRRQKRISYNPSPCLICGKRFRSGFSSGRVHKLLTPAVQALISSATVFVVSRGGCPYCTKVKSFLSKNRYASFSYLTRRQAHFGCPYFARSIEFKSVELDGESDFENLHSERE